MKIERITGVLGAIVTGVHLGDATDGQIEEVRQALARHHVVVLRGQDLSEEEQLAAAARFGELFHGDTSREAMSRIENSEQKLPATDKWHADSSFLENPPTFGFLRAEKVPPHGGDTMWVSLHAAYETLSPGLQRLAESLSARHVVTEAYVQAAKEYFGNAPDADFQRSGHDHPLVIENPRNGKKALYLSPRYLDRLIGVTEEESAALLRLFDSQLDRPAHQLRWKWTPDDLVIWDERSVAHRGLSDHFYEGPQYRLMKQCLAGGPAPAAA